MTHKNPLRDLHRFGVSVWYDYVSRSLISSGELKRLIEEDGVRGVTSNPSIFEKAIGGSNDYDSDFRALAYAGASSSDIYDHLSLKDIAEHIESQFPMVANATFLLTLCHQPCSSNLFLEQGTI